MSDIYLTRLKALRDFGFPLAEQKETEGHLDFDIYMSECGTYGCLLGWWATTEYARREGWVPLKGAPPVWGDTAHAAEDYFDLSYEERCSLFADSEVGTLSDRKAYLETIIQRRSPPNTP